jgi:GxxExxY protein
MIEATLSNTVIGAFYSVYNALGFGFLEHPYANALAIELQYLGLKVRREVPTEIVYRGVPVGTYRADMIVNERLLIEVKAAKTITEADERQLLNYLRATDIQVGLLLHFGPKPHFRRLIYTNDRK